LVFAKVAVLVYNLAMTKFEPLSPQEARKIEAEAVTKFMGKTPVEKKPKLAPGEIAHIKAIFPFQLFPDELIIKRETVTFINRLGPGMKQSRTIHFDDIAQVEADLGPIFAHLHIIPKLRTEEQMIIDRISRKDALATEKLVEEIIESHHLKHESSY
jgi:hypothetical protein